MHPAYIIHVFEHRAYPLEREIFSIGRDTANDVCIREANVSRHHLEITRGESAYLLAPVGTAPVRLNGQPIKESHPLQDGDSIGVAYETFIFTMGSLPLGVTIVDEVRDRDPDPATTRPTIVHTALTDPALRAERKPMALWPVYIGVAIIVGALMYLGTL
jgi:pSer/pThr/pTyr-binding forkhead associated (FHA) protein